MKKLFISIIGMLHCFILIPQINLSGNYYNESGMCIKIDNDKFHFIIHQQHLPVYSNDTLAECSFSWIDNQFIELKSIPPYIIVQKGLKISQSSDPILKDSIKLSFSIPYQRKSLKIKVYANMAKTFALSYSKNNRDLLLPNNIKTISFYIEPEYVLPSIPDGLCYSIIGFDFFQEYQIEKNANHIDIEIPAIDDSFFEKYYVKGDYAKVSKDSITWKGEVFVKKK